MSVISWTSLRCFRNLKILMIRDVETQRITLNRKVPSSPSEKVITVRKIKVKGSWSSGHDIALTQRRSPVQIRPGPLLLVDTREFDVTIVDKSELHYYQPWFLYVAFKGSRRKIWKPNADLLKPGITFVQDEIREVNLDQKKAYGTRRLIYEYDYVVIATGTSPDPDSIPGLRAIYDECGDYHPIIVRGI